MALSASIMQALFDAGCTPEQVVAGAKAAEADVERAESERQAERRERDRVRKRNARAKEKIQQNQHSRPNCPADIADTPSLDKENPPDPLKKLIPSPKENPLRGQKKRGTLCPEDFFPTESHFRKGATYGFDRDRVEAEADQMRDWSHANANRVIARKADWGRTFFGWMKNAAERDPPKNTPADRRARQDAMFAALNEKMGIDHDEPSETLRLDNPAGAFDLSEPDGAIAGGLCAEPGLFDGGLSGIRGSVPDGPSAWDSGDMQIFANGGGSEGIPGRSLRGAREAAPPPACIATSGKKV